MKLAEKSYLEPPKSLRAELESDWRQAVDYYKKHSPVVFVSDHDRFWEPHGFVQQSLAKELTQAGVPVVWLDGRGWRKYRPTIPFESSILRVHGQAELPGKRFRVIDELNVQLRTSLIRRALKGKGLLWVQSGIDERIADKLDNIDVFSVFDNPYHHLPKDPLLQKANCVVTQNTFARNHLNSFLGAKVRTLPPPVDVDMDFGPMEKFPIRADFPKKIMGYIGSCFFKAFDFSLLETFVESFPQYGFVIAGRTDEAGRRAMDRLKTYGNFQYIPWVPRNQVLPLWKLLDVSLLLYRTLWEQDGAFPIKVLEALRLGIPSVATAVHKTADLQKDFARSPFPSVLRAHAERAMDATVDSQRLLFEKYYLEMHPKRHLVQVAHWLKNR